MGRIFEKRKHKIFARNAKMSKAFTKIGREIAIAVKSGGSDPSVNARLRAVMQNARSLNMPKDRVEAAIKKASRKEEANFDEIVYEGYAPHGIALVIETATDNPTRTVANVRMYLTRNGGSLGTSGSVGFLFERKALFKIADKQYDLDELTLNLIDGGAEEVEKDESAVFITTDFTDYGKMQKTLEEMGAEILESSKLRVPLNTVELNDSQRAEVEHILELLEDDDDVQEVFHNMG